MTKDLSTLSKIALGAAVMSFTLADTNPAESAIVTYEFTLDLEGTTTGIYMGTFSYDDEKPLAENFTNFVVENGYYAGVKGTYYQLTDFQFSIEGISFGLSDWFNYGEIVFDESNDLPLFGIFENGDYGFVGGEGIYFSRPLDDEYDLTLFLDYFLTNQAFVYVAQDYFTYPFYQPINGSGTISYTIPEPVTLLGTVTALALGATFKRKLSKIPTKNKSKA